MALVAGQLSSTSNPVLSISAVVPLVSVPAGPCTVIISNTSGATVFVAPGGTAPTAAGLQGNGLPIPSGAPPVEFSTYPGSTGSTLYIVGASGGTITGAVGWLLSTAR